MKLSFGPDDNGPDLRTVVEYVIKTAAELGQQLTVTENQDGSYSLASEGALVS